MNDLDLIAVDILIYALNQSPEALKMDGAEHLLTLLTARKEELEELASLDLSDCAGGACKL